MNIFELYRDCVERLTIPGIPDPELDARALIARRMGLDRNELLLNKDRIVTSARRKQVLADVARRAKLEPVAYILGYKDFYRDRFIVSRRTLIPRADTEHLLYAAEDLKREFRNIIDIGTGTGALAVSLCRLYPGAQVTAIDTDTRTAARNIKKTGVKNITLRTVDFLEPGKRGENFLGSQGPFDLIVSNPPYLSPDDFELMGADARLYEPRKAFYGGEDGLDFYRAIAAFAKKGGLTKNGRVIVETDHKWDKACEIFRNAGFKKADVRKDYNGLVRVIIAG